MGIFSPQPMPPTRPSQAIALVSSVFSGLNFSQMNQVNNLWQSTDQSGTTLIKAGDPCRCISITLQLRTRAPISDGRNSPGCQLCCCKLGQGYANSWLEIAVTAQSNPKIAPAHC